MFIERHLGDIGLGDDGINTHCADAVLVKQPARNFEYAITRRSGKGFGGDHAHKYTDLSVYCQRVLFRYEKSLDRGAYSTL